MAKNVYKKKNKIHVFDVVNYLVFILIGLFILVPIWKVVVDSFNAVGVYQFQLWPNRPTLALKKEFKKIEPLIKRIMIEKKLYKGVKQ